MERPIRVMLASGVLYLLLIFASASPNLFPNPELIGHVLHEAQIMAIGIFLTGLIVWVLGEQFEKLTREIPHSVQEGIQASLKDMNATISNGFSIVAGALAKEFRGFSESWRGLSGKQREELLSSVQSPEVKRMVETGNLKEAVSKLDELVVQSETERKELVAVLLLSADAANWERALKLIEEDKRLQQASYYLTLAYRYWSVKELDRAIQLAEAGLRLAENKEPDQHTLGRLKNSLAYYYADAQKPDKESLARQYALEGVEMRPNDLKPLDTLGYVKITYGKTKHEILDGVENCEAARKGGNAFQFYAKHIARAELRLSQAKE